MAEIAHEHVVLAMFGGVRAKLYGLKHVYVQYLGKLPQPIHLYGPYVALITFAGP